MSAGSRPRGRRRSRGHAEEEHENSERWLVTYGDMLTLLMVLFIVLFAISQVDQKKFEELKMGLTSGFGAPAQLLDGTQGVLSDPGVRPEPFDLRDAAVPKDAALPKDQAKADAATASAGRAQADATRAVAQREVDRLEAVRRAISAALAKEGLRDRVRFRYDDRGLVVSIVTDQVLFPADRAELAPIGHRVLDIIAPVLARLPDLVLVEGHTNQAPVKPKYFPTEWELSSARAVTVVRALIADGVAPKRLTASGLADQHPLLPPSNPRALEVNRRVEIVIQSTLPAGIRALVAQLAPPGDAP